MALCTRMQPKVSMSEKHSLHSSSKVCMVYDAIHLLLALLLFHKPRDVFRHARHGPLACNLNPICEEFDGAIACDIHVSVLGFRAVETAKACGMFYCSETNIRSQYVIGHGAKCMTN